MDDKGKVIFIKRNKYAIYVISKAHLDNAFAFLFSIITLPIQNHLVN